MLVEFDTTAPIDGYLMRSPESDQWRIVLFRAQPCDGGASVGFTYSTRSHPSAVEAVQDAMAASKAGCVVTTEHLMPDNTNHSTLHFLPTETK